MPAAVSDLVARVLEVYALLGLAFALIFLPRGALRVDHRLAASPVTVRLLILPGVAALWPLFLRRWATGRTEPFERNPHRTAAGAR